MRLGGICCKMIGNDIPWQIEIIIIYHHFDEGSPLRGTISLNPCSLDMVGHHALAPLSERHFFPGRCQSHVEFLAQKVHCLDFGIIGPNNAVDVPPSTALFHRRVIQKTAPAPALSHSLRASFSSAQGKKRKIEKSKGSSSS